MFIVSPLFPGNLGSNCRPIFEPAEVFEVLYKDIFSEISKDRVMAFEGSEDVILRSDFINTVERHLERDFEQSIRESTPASEIHRGNLGRFGIRWREIQSTSTCLSCLRRRPQYGLPCGHAVCENCVLIFGDCSVDNLWIFKVPRCILCGVKMSEVAVQVHPPTSGVGVLCINGGGARGVVPLKLMKRIQDRIGLPI